MHQSVFPRHLHLVSKRLPHGVPPSISHFPGNPLWKLARAEAQEPCSLEVRGIFFSWYMQFYSYPPLQTSRLLAFKALFLIWVARWFKVLQLWENMSCKQRQAWARDTISVSDCPVRIICMLFVYLLLLWHWWSQKMLEKHTWACKNSKVHASDQNHLQDHTQTARSQTS